MKGAGAPVAFEVSTLLVERPTGVAVYGSGLLRAIAALHSDRQHWQIYGWARAHRRRFLPVPELPSLPFATGARLHRRFGLVHALDTRLPSRYRGPLVATVYDTISALPLAKEKGLSTPRFIARKLRAYERIARRADAVIAISEETRARFSELTHPKVPVAVVRPGIAPEFLAAGESGPTQGADAAAGPQPGLPANRYLLWVGALCPRKNLEAALGAWRRARARAPGLALAVVGEPGKDWNERGGRNVSLMEEGVRLLGYVERHELARLYANAAALLYLSHYEGFGLPVLEAMAAGTPVVAARRGGIPEAAGEAALLVDPDRPEEVDLALARALEDRACAVELRALGRRRASEFTWRAAAEAVEAVYDEARARAGHRLRERLE